MDGRQEELIPEREAALLVVQQAHLQQDHTVKNALGEATDASHRGRPPSPSHVTP